MSKPEQPSEYQSVVAEYRNRASDYDRQWAGYIEATVARTLQAMFPLPEGDILDIGCGTGVLLEALSQHHPKSQLTGIDPVSEMLDIARERLPEAVDLRLGRAEQLPFADDVFDRVVTSSTFHYVEQPLTALQEMRRVLRPGGRVIITDWCRDYLSIRLCGKYLRLSGQPFHRIYRSRELAEMLHKAGFSDFDTQRYKINWLWGLMTVSATRQGTHKPVY